MLADEVARQPPQQAHAERARLQRQAAAAAARGTKAEQIRMLRQMQLGLQREDITGVTYVSVVR